MVRNCAQKQFKFSTKACLAVSAVDGTNIYEFTVCINAFSCENGSCEWDRPFRGPFLCANGRRFKQREVFQPLSRCFSSLNVAVV